jgi:uncharacterized protein YndB with AHSA1/START domain
MTQHAMGQIVIRRIVESICTGFDALSFFPETTREDWARHRTWMEPWALDPSGNLILPIQAFLIRTRHHTILVDTCVGDHKPRPRRPFWHMQKLNTFLPRLAAAGVAPEDVDYVMCTHLHWDHCGWNTQLWDRLAEYLEEESSGKHTFVINRSFDAPLDVMFEMWSNPKHFSQWLAPTGFEMQFLRSDIRPGGSTFYFMTGPGGAKMYGRAEYREIHQPDRLVYTQQFCDEHEKISRHPRFPTWPETMLTTVNLTAEGPDRTRVTVTWEPHGAVTREELETFIKSRAGMTQGWTGSFDKLESYLAKR